MILLARGVTYANVARQGYEHRMDRGTRVADPASALEPRSKTDLPRRTFSTRQASSILLFHSFGFVCQDSPI